MLLNSILSIPAALLRWRWLIFDLVSRELRARYANASLGSLWHILQPLGLILVYTFVFSELMKARLPGDASNTSYSVFLCAGLLPWTLFNELVSRGTTMFVEQAPLLKKSAIPRICIPVVMAINALVTFSILFVFFVTWMWMFVPTSPKLSAILLPLALLTVFGFALGILFGVLNVFIRDVAQIVTMTLQFGFWLTPIVWPITTLPERWQNWIYLNPLVPIVQNLQSVMLGQSTSVSLTYPAIICAAALVLAAIYFAALGRRMTDEL